MCRSSVKSCGGAARTLLDLRESWEWATKEERKILVHTMIQEVGCDVGTKRIVWVKACPDYEPLFSILEGMLQNTVRRFWIERKGAPEDNCDMEADTASTGVEILSPCPTPRYLDKGKGVSTKRILHFKSEIAQLLPGDPQSAIPRRRGWVPSPR